MARYRTNPNIIIMFFLTIMFFYFMSHNSHIFNSSFDFEKYSFVFFTPLFLGIILISFNPRPLRRIKINDKHIIFVFLTGLWFIDPLKEFLAVSDQTLLYATIISGVYFLFTSRLFKRELNNVSNAINKNRAVNSFIKNNHPFLMYDRGWRGKLFHTKPLLYNKEDDVVAYKTNDLIIVSEEYRYKGIKEILEKKSKKEVAEYDQETIFQAAKNNVKNKKELLAMML